MHACFEDGDRIAPLGYRVVGGPAGACNRARSGLARLRAAALGIVPQALAVALERGLKARVADVVGLELCLRRKGEPIDPLTLHLCVLQAFMWAPGSGGAGEAETLVSVVGRSYERWSKLFLSVPPDQWQTVFDLSQMALLEAGKHLSDHAESDDAAQAGDEMAVDDV